MNPSEKMTQNKTRESLCIPRIESTVKREYIFKKLCMLKIGYIQKMTEIPLKNNPDYKRVLIRIQWNDSEKTNKIRERLGQGDSINFVYDMPWFWKISYSL
jgi:hypothetical protein